MKRLASLLVVLSLAHFAVGCAPTDTTTDDTSTTTTDTSTDTTTDDTTSDSGE